MASNSLQVLRQILQTLKKGPGFDRVLSQLEVVSGGEGKCVCELNVAEEHLNRQGTLHGGMTATMVDMVSTKALMTTGHHQPGVSVELSISFIKAARPGDTVIISAHADRVGRSLAFLSVALINKNTGDLIAKGSHTKYVRQT